MAEMDTLVDTSSATEIRRLHRSAGEALEIETARRAVLSSLFSAPGLEAPTVGRYVLRRCLGSGGTGVVFEAHDPRLDRSVAVKLLHSRTTEPFPGDSTDTLRLEEAQHAAKLVHPAVVKIFDAGLHEGRVFIAMELIEGPSMREWLRSRPPWRHRVAVLAMAARGLEAAHQRGITHGGFTPATVLLGWEGRVCVTEFGLARGFVDAPSAEDASHVVAGAEVEPRGLTDVDGAAAAPAYLAPEQHLGTAQDERSDQFAFCVSLYEALVGRRPFNGANLAELRDAILTAEPAMPPLHDVPDVLVRAISRGLSKNRRDRLENMGELAALLESLTTEVELSRVLRDEALRSGAFQAPMYDQYVRDLPVGLATTPDEVVPHLFTQVALAHRPLAFPPSELIPTIDTARTPSRSRSRRGPRLIPAVPARAILCAIYDEHFRSLDTWIPFAERVSQTMVRLLFAGFAVAPMASPHYPHSVAAVFNNHMQGGRAKVLHHTNHAATVVVEHPPQAMNEVIRVAIAEFFRAVMLASGAGVAAVNVLQRDDDSFELEAHWR